MINDVMKMVPFPFFGSFLHFHTRFSSGESRGLSPLGGRGIPHDKHQSRAILLAPHQDETKLGRKCSQSTWSLDDL